VFPLANLVATHQIKTGDGIKVTLDKDAELDSYRFIGKQEYFNNCHAAWSS
jgi:hypothetical protein